MYMAEDGLRGRVCTNTVAAFLVEDMVAQYRNGL